MRAEWAGVMISTLTGIFVLSGVAMAHDWTARRQARQIQRIRQGIRSGQITPVERRRLLREERRIRKVRRRAWRDGTLEPWEARRLDRMLDRASEDIYWAKHNRLRRHHRPLVCEPPRLHKRRPPVTYVWPEETHFFFSGFFSDPSWGFGWSVSDP